MVSQSAPIMKVTQINSLAMSPCIHSTRTDVAYVWGGNLDVLICVCVVTCIIDGPMLLPPFKAANENHLSMITASIEIWGQKRKCMCLFSYHHFFCLPVVFLTLSLYAKHLSAAQSPALCLQQILNPNIFVYPKDKQTFPSQVKRAVQALTCKLLVGILVNTFLVCAGQ